MTRELTGWHATAIIGSGFAVIIAVNLVLATQAVATFPGLEVKNSYVASQSFDADRAAQEALDWTVGATATPTRLTLSVTGADGRPADATILAATLGRATHVGEDQQPDFVFGDGVWTAPIAARPGYWNLRLDLAAADGTRFRQRVQVVIE